MAERLVGACKAHLYGQMVAVHIDYGAARVDRQINLLRAPHHAAENENAYEKGFCMTHNSGYEL